MSIHPKRESPGSNSGPASSSSPHGFVSFCPFSLAIRSFLNATIKLAAAVCALPSPAEKFLAEYYII